MDYILRGNDKDVTNVLKEQRIRINRKVCQNAHLLFFTHKAPTFTSWGFVIT